MLAQIGHRLKLLADILGKLIVQLRQGPLAHLARSDVEMLGFAGEFLVGKILAVGETYLALFTGAHTDQALFELRTRRILVTDKKIALLEPFADYGHAAFVEPLQVGDKHIALFQWPFNGLFGRLTTAQFLELLGDFLIGHFVHHAGRIEFFVVLDLDLGPNVQRRSEGQITAWLVVELGDLRRSSRY